MKMHFLIKYVFVVCLLPGSLLADHNEKKEYEHIECTIVPIHRQGRKAPHGVYVQTTEAEYVSQPHVSASHLVEIQLPEYTSQSTNWSGYAAANNLSNPTTNSVSAVFGSWIIPAIVPSINDSYSAYWIGIDGFASPTVEQIGTAHDFVSGVEDYYVWFEMYPNPAFQIVGFPITPGDVFSASVTHTGGGVFVLTIMNDTANVSFTVPTSFTTAPGALRNGAEWIIEAPFLNGILPLSDFVTGYMFNGTATINAVTAPINNGSWQHVDIQMITNTNVPKATPTTVLQDNESFFVVWEHQ